MLIARRGGIYYDGIKNSTVNFDQSFLYKEKRNGQSVSQNKTRFPFNQAPLKYRCHGNTSIFSLLFWPFVSIVSSIKILNNSDSNVDPRPKEPLCFPYLKYFINMFLFRPDFQYGKKFWSCHSYRWERKVTRREAPNRITPAPAQRLQKGE